MRVGIFNIPRTFIVLAAAVLLLLVLLSVFGCAAKLGPGPDGWASWDVCGFEGGVAAELNIMGAGARLGCTNPVGAGEPEDGPEPAP